MKALILAVVTAVCACEGAGTGPAPEPAPTPTSIPTPEPAPKGEPAPVPAPTPAPRSPLPASDVPPQVATKLRLRMHKRGLEALVDPVDDGYVAPDMPAPAVSQSSR
jgi:hypothetical protein